MCFVALLFLYFHLLDTKLQKMKFVCAFSLNLYALSMRIRSIRLFFFLNIRICCVENFLSSLEYLSIYHHQLVCFLSVEHLFFFG